jgi:hypothetical protein
MTELKTRLDQGPLLMDGARWFGKGHWFVAVGYDQQAYSGRSAPSRPRGFPEADRRGSILTGRRRKNANVSSWQCDSLKRVDFAGYLVAAAYNLVRLVGL